MVETATCAVSHIYSNPSPACTCSSTETAVTWGHRHIQTATGDGVHTGHTARNTKTTSAHQEVPHSCTQRRQSHMQRPSQPLLLPFAVCPIGSVTRSQTHVHSLLPTQLCHIHPEAYLIGNGQHQTMPGSQVLRVPHARPIPGHVDGEACACGPAHLAGGALIPHGKEGAIIIAVQGNVEHTARDRVGRGPCLVSSLAPLKHGPPTSLAAPTPCPSPSPGVVLKYVLSSIAMMHIPVYNQDPEDRELVSYSGHWPPGRRQGPDHWGLSAGAYIVGHQILSP